MNIVKNQEGSKLELLLSGRLDTTTAPQLESALNEDMAAVTELILNFEGLEYISSAGLRVLLAAQKQMNRKGSMVVKNVCEDIRDVFDITGFSDILTVE